MTKRTILLDGDVVAYKFAISAERATDWGDGLWTLHAEAGPAVGKMQSFVELLQEALEADKVIVALSDRENFRKLILPTYKHNRKDVRKPMILGELREKLADVGPIVQRPTLEGDDVLGILATSPAAFKAMGGVGEGIIASVDKDMKTIPGLHYNTGKPDEGVFSITLEQADYWHLFQTLTGDSTDGYAGCPGIGEKRAEAILFGDHPPFGTPAEAWAAVVETYKKAKLTEDDALVQARVARILRASDYNFKTKEPILWSPKAL